MLYVVPCDPDIRMRIRSGWEIKKEVSISVFGETCNMSDFAVAS